MKTSKCPSCGKRMKNNETICDKCGYQFCINQYSVKFPLYKELGDKADRVAKYIASVKKIDIGEATDLLKNGRVVIKRNIGLEQAKIIQQKFKNVGIDVIITNHQKKNERKKHKHMRFVPWVIIAIMFVVVGAVACIALSNSDFNLHSIDQKSPNQAGEEIQETGEEDTTTSEEKIYLSAKELLDEGKYAEANELFSEIPDYKDVTLLSEQALYESYVFPVIEEIISKTKTYDTIVFHEIIFFNEPISYDFNGDGLNNDDGKIDTGNFPVCIIHYSCTDTSGEITPFFTMGAYYLDTQNYSILFSSNSLTKIYSDDTFYCCGLMNSCYDNFDVAGNVDIGRISKIFNVESSTLNCYYSGCTDIGRYSIANISDIHENYCKTHYYEVEELYKEQKEERMKALDIEIKNALEKFNAKTDKIAGTTTYSSYNEPYYADTRCFILPQIIYYDTNNIQFYGMRVIVHYTGDSWIFWDKLTFYADGESYTKKFDYFDIKHDNDSGDVWEWGVYLPTESEKEVLSKIANSTEAIVRFHGDTYYYDMTVSAEDKQAIKDFLAADELMSQRYENINEKYN